MTSWSHAINTGHAPEGDEQSIPRQARLTHQQGGDAYSDERLKLIPGSFLSDEGGTVSCRLSTQPCDLVLKPLTMGSHACIVAVNLPIVSPALVMVGLVGFISAARAIGTVVLLGSGRSRTLSLLMLDFTAGAEFKKATVVAVMVMVLVVAAALLARIFGGNVAVRE